MLFDVVEVQALGGYRVFLRFEDGRSGEIDLEPRLTFRGVFSDLRNEAAFKEVSVNPELGTIVWPGGADIDPAVLRAWLDEEHQNVASV